MGLSDSNVADRTVLPSTRDCRGEEGYTLIEILVVLSIIALVMGLVGPRVLSYLSDSKVKAAKIQISNLTAALDLYYLDIGTYPNASEGLQALVQKPAGASNWNGPYLKSSLPNDPWGKPYLYRVPGEHGAYTILSLGADGREGGNGTDADISNDREQRSSSATIRLDDRHAGGALGRLHLHPLSPPSRGQASTRTIWARSRRSPMRRARWSSGSLMTPGASGASKILMVAFSNRKTGSHFS